MSKERFPRSIRKMRAEISDGPIIQVRAVTAMGSIIECEGPITKKTLDKVLALIIQGFKKRSPKNR